MTRESERFLAGLDRLSSADRVRRVVIAARAADGDSLVAGLAAGDRYSRELALLAARYSGRFATVLAATDDPEVELRSLAAVALPGFAQFGPGQAVAHNGVASPAEREALHRGIRAARRSDLAEAVLAAEVAAHRTSAAAKLLPLCSAEVVEEWIDALAPSLGSAVQLAARHPGAFVAHADRELAALPPLARTSWWSRRSAAALVAARSDHDAVFGLLERFPPAAGWNRQHRALLSELLRRDLPRGLSLVLTGGVGSLDLSRRSLRWIVASRLDLADELGRAFFVGNPGQYRRLVLGADPADRARFIEVVAERVGRLSQDDLLLDLAAPAALREADARAALIRAEERGASPWPALARLPLTEAEPRARELLASALAADRGVAYRTLIESAAHAGAAELLRLLEGFDRLSNEQEPVRSVAIAALAGLPCRLFDERHVPALTKIARDAYEARDASYASSRPLQDLAVRLLGNPRTAPGLRDFAISALTTAPGGFSLPELEQLPRPAVDLVVEALLPVIDEHTAIGRYDVLVTLVEALYQRAWGRLDLDSRLEAMAASTDDWMARQAIDRWLADPATRTARARSLVEKERSALTLPVVERVATRTATELLTDAAIDGRVSGRFQQKSAVWIVPTGGSRRWTRHQRERAAARLAAIAERESLEIWLQVRALRAASAIPGFGLPPVLAATKSDSVYFAEQAVALLGRFGADSAVDDALVSALGTDRARVAGAAAVSRAGLLRSVELETFLAVALEAPIRVTSRKSLVFAVGRAALAEPWPVLDRVIGSRPHPDVVTAAVSVALRRLADPRAVPFVVEHVAHDSRAAALLAGLEPVASSPAVRRAVADTLAVLCAVDDARVRQAAAGAARRWVAFSPVLREAIWTLVTDLGKPTSLLAESQAVGAMLESGYAVGLSAAVVSLVESGKAASAETEPFARRRIEVLVDEVSVYGGHPAEAAALGELVSAVQVLASTGGHTIDATRIAIRLLAEGAEDLVAVSTGGYPASGAAALERAWLAPGDSDLLLDRLDARTPELANGAEPAQVLAAGILARLRRRGPLDGRTRGLLATLRSSDNPQAGERAWRISAD